MSSGLSIFRSIREAVNYTMPKSEELRLYDFYVAAYFDTLDATSNRVRGIGGFREEEWREDLSYAVGVILPTLKRDLLEAAFFSVCAEIRHLTSRKQPQRIAEDPIFQSFNRRYVSYTASNNPDSRKPEDSDAYKGDHRGYHDSFLAVKATMEKRDITRARFMDFAVKAFNEGTWNASYGGEPWAGIAEGWLLLNRAATKPETAIAIDHLYSLQHNTGTVFNKVKRFAVEGGYNWLQKALDKKASAKNILEIIPHASGQMKRIVRVAAKDLGLKLDPNPSPTPDVSPQSKSPRGGEETDAPVLGSTKSKSPRDRDREEKAMRMAFEEAGTKANLERLNSVLENLFSQMISTLARETESPETQAIFKKCLSNFRHYDELFDVFVPLVLNSTFPISSLNVVISSDKPELAKAQQVIRAVWAFNGGVSKPLKGELRGAMAEMWEDAITNMLSFDEDGWNFWQSANDNPTYEGLDVIGDPKLHNLAYTAFFKGVGLAYTAFFFKGVAKQSRTTVADAPAKPAQFTNWDRAHKKQLRAAAAEETQPHTAQLIDATIKAAFKDEWKRLETRQRFLVAQVMKEGQLQEVYGIFKRYLLNRAFPNAFHAVVDVSKCCAEAATVAYILQTRSAAILAKSPFMNALEQSRQTVLKRVTAKIEIKLLVSEDALEVQMGHDSKMKQMLDGLGYVLD